MSSASSIDDFEIGKAIFEKLKDLPADRTERIMRWVGESLGLTTAITHAPAPSPVNHQISPPSNAGTGPKDIKSFVTEKAPKSDNQFAATVAYYFRFEAPEAQRRESIDADTLQNAARLAGRNRLSDPASTLKNAKNTGYLDLAGRGEYSVNSVGENLVAMTLPGNGEKRAPVRRGGKGKLHKKGPKKGK